MNSSSDFTYVMPPSFDLPSFHQFMVKATTSLGASDIYLQTGRPLCCRIEGEIQTCSDRTLLPQEVEAILVHTYRAEAGISQVRSGQVLDYAWDYRLDRTTRLRYRVNCTGIWSDRGIDGFDLTFRVLPQKTPSLKDVGLANDIYDRCIPVSGIVLVVGGTGQGKSTTMAAIIGHCLQQSSIRIVDIQAPIEYTFQDIARDNPRLAQSEVPRHIPDFAESVWAALRRSPDVISIGETRDQATVKALISASLTGHRVYTTLHAGNVVESFRRLLAMTYRQGEIAGDLPLVLRFIIAQRLLPGITGRRQVVREYLAISDEVRQQLWQAETLHWPRVINQIMLEPPPGMVARPFGQDCRELLIRGKITEQVAINFLQSVGGGDLS